MPAVFGSVFTIAKHNLTVNTSREIKKPPNHSVMAERRVLGIDGKLDVIQADRAAIRVLGADNDAHYPATLVAGVIPPLDEDVSVSLGAERAIWLDCHTTQANDSCPGPRRLRSDQRPALTQIAPEQIQVVRLASRDTHAARIVSSGRGNAGDIITIEHGRRIYLDHGVGVHLASHRVSTNHVLVVHVHAEGFVLRTDHGARVNLTSGVVGARQRLKRLRSLSISVSGENDGQNQQRDQQRDRKTLDHCVVLPKLGTWRLECFRTS